MNYIPSVWSHELVARNSGDPRKLRTVALFPERNPVLNALQYQSLANPFRERHMKIQIRLSVKNSKLLLWTATFLGAARPEVATATCPDCGTTDLRRTHRKSHIERLLRTPWSVIQKALGGRLYWCRRCRVQFFDCRRLLPADSVGGNSTPSL